MTAGPDRKTYTPERRAQVVAALLAGDSERFVAQTFNVGRTTARRWLAEARAAAGTHALTPRVEVVEDQPTIGQLIGVMLREQLITLAAQARFLRDPAWLARQPAGELAVLHGVMHDKAVRVLAALQPDGDPPENIDPHAVHTSDSSGR